MDATAAKPAVALQAVVLPATTPTFICSSDGEFVSANDALLNWLGYGPHDIDDLRISLVSGNSAGIGYCRRCFSRKDGTAIDTIVFTAQDAASQSLVCFCFPSDELRSTDRLAVHLLDRVDEEKRIMARRLHDVAAQNLAALAMNFSMAEARIPADPALQELMAECSELTGRCLTEVRELSYMLYPPLLDELGLESALRSYIRTFSNSTHVRTEITVTPKFPRLAHDLESGLFRIIEERLNYFRSSCHPIECRIAIEESGTSIVLSVWDNSVATQSDSRAEQSRLSFSSAAIAERARQIGAILNTVQGPQGTTIRAIIARR